ncbi:MAG TPA: hypothetical protein VIL37_03950 [Natronosporangium sp.]
MTVQARDTRGWTGGRRRVLAALLAIAVLVPLGVLFLDHSRHLSERRSAVTEERHGIEYLLALGQLTVALTDAKSATVNGEPIAQEAMDRAIAGVAEVDDRFGDELRVRERWARLRDAIELANSTDHPDPRAAYAAYGEVTTLLLGLFDRVRENSGLVREPDQDSHHLQDAAGGRLPETMIAAGQLVDLVNIAAAEQAGPQATTEILIALDAVTRPGDALVAGIQAALDSTESRSLSSSVLGVYDRFLRAKDGLLLTVPADGDPAAADLQLLGAIRTELHAAGDDLFQVLLTELDTLVAARGGELARSQWTTVGATLVGVLLALGLAALSLLGGGFDRTDRQAGQHSRHGELPPGGDGAGRPADTPQLATASPLMSISDGVADYESGRRTPATREQPLAGELLGSERADVR